MRPCNRIGDLIIHIVQHLFSLSFQNNNNNNNNRVSLGVEVVCAVAQHCNEANQQPGYGPLALKRLLLLLLPLPSLVLQVGLYSTDVVGYSLLLLSSLLMASIHPAHNTTNTGHGNMYNYTVSCSTWLCNTVEPPIKDAPNKGQLRIKDTIQSTKKPLCYYSASTFLTSE